MAENDSKVKKKPKDVNELDYEEAFDELREVVAKLEAHPRDDRLSLEEAIGLYARGEMLTKRCDALLKSAEARIEGLRGDDKDDDGS